VIRLQGPPSPYDPTYHLFTRFDKIREICARERPDILEIHSPYLAAAGALRARRADYGARTFQWHSDSIDTYLGVLRAGLARDGASHGPAAAARGAGPRVAGGGWRAGSAPFWALSRAIAKRCDATLVASRTQADKLEAHGVARVVRRPFGIDHDAFTPAARSDAARARLRDLAGASAGATLLVAVGRLAIEKQLAFVIDAVGRAARARDLALVVLGDGPERARLEARAAAQPHGSFGFAGFVKGRTELAALLASADGLVHGCPWETFGLSIAEAMSAGLPVVVPDQGGASELHEPASGETYAALDPSAFEAAIHRVCARFDRGERPAMGAAARARAAELPTVAGAFEAQIEIYQAILDRSRK
jgi:alpha-1,6-mannosyltransferase